MSTLIAAVRSFVTYVYVIAFILIGGVPGLLFAIATKAAVNGTTGAVAEMGAATKAHVGVSPTLSAIIDEIYNSAAYFDATNIPDTERYVFVTPSLYWDLVQDGSFLNRDFGNEGNGSKAKTAWSSIITSLVKKPVRKSC